MKLLKALVVLVSSFLLFSCTQLYQTEKSVGIEIPRCILEQFCKGKQNGRNAFDSNPVNIDVSVYGDKTFSFSNQIFSTADLYDPVAVNGLQVGDDVFIRVEIYNDDIAYSGTAHQKISSSENMLDLLLIRTFYIKGEGGVLSGSGHNVLETQGMNITKGSKSTPVTDTALYDCFASFASLSSDFIVYIDGHAVESEYCLSLSPGVRAFIDGYSKNSCLEIDVKDKIFIIDGNSIPVYYGFVNYNVQGGSSYLCFGKNSCGKSFFIKSDVPLFAADIDVDKEAGVIFDYVSD